MSRQDIAAVMVTVDRSPEQNYLGQTLKNLDRAGIATSERLESLCIMDSGPAASGVWAADTVCSTYGPMAAGKVFTCSHDEHVVANLNVAAALRMGNAAEWTLFLEDDIDVCDDFFDSVGRWLDAHAQANILVYAFGCAYPAVAHQVSRGAEVWDYALQRFFGTQCFAMRSTDAASLANYLEAHCYDKNPAGTCYDLLMSSWALERDSKATHFLASCPSFVQHVGKSSIIAPREKVHEFPSWPGIDWSYA